MITVFNTEYKGSHLVITHHRSPFRGFRRASPERSPLQLICPRTTTAPIFQATYTQIIPFISGPRNTAKAKATPKKASIIPFLLPTPSLPKKKI
jgi:hypothetical protein